MTEALEFRVHGMDCADEVAILKREIGPIVGSADGRLMFDILRGKMTVAVGAPPVNAAQIQAAVAKTGMRAEPWIDVQPDAARLGFWQRRGRTALTAASGLLLGAGFLAHALASGVLAALGSEGAALAEAPPDASILFYAAAIVAGGWFVAVRAWRALLRLRPDMNLLMTMAVIGAVAIGEWFEAAVVSFLFAFSLALESWSIGRARRAVEALLAIAPDTARVITQQGAVVESPAADVALGARVLVKPGDRIPLDGTVLKGNSSIDQAPITGESVPVDKAPGAEVFAGTINVDGALEVEVTRLAGESTLAQIIRMVGEAQARRAPSEQWVDRFARVYTPAILGLAILVAVIPPALMGGDWSDWFYRGLVLLVIGCPCALVISTPVSIVASLAAAAKNGVLVKGGAFIEAPARLRALALDKTGTLTEGRHRVIDVLPMSGHTQPELLSAMAAVEAHSDHPLARAIVDYVQSLGVEPGEAEDVRARHGRGVTATINGKEYWLGSHRYLVERKQETPEILERIEQLSSAGRSVVIMGTADHVCGLVTLADAVRADSRAAVAALESEGVDHVVMLTGDNAATAYRIAAEVGIKEVKAELLPAQKVAAVEQLVRTYGTVAMIGDGVNDAPAMGRATFGIAMAAAGSDAAIEAADVALMSDDLGKLPWLVRHSRRTLSIIHQNVVASLAIKVLFVILTFLGISALWMAIVADMGVSLIVIANALRLLHTKEPTHYVSGVLLA
ncbi:MAG: heavy metal translocating P-type ATPase [Longimicrobiales bacterium]